MSGDFTARDIEVVTVEKVSDGGTVTWTNGWSFGGIPKEHRPLFVVGAEFLSESVRMTQVTGMATIYRARTGEVVVDEWLWHKTDADLEREHAEMVAGFKRQREEEWTAHREDWAQREARLPHPLRRRLERFRANGGHDFETDGWGYELTVCELAVLYAKAGGEETPEVNAYASKHGTSGNQHDCAKWLSQSLTSDPADEDTIANAPSALTPLTGDGDYSGAVR